MKQKVLAESLKRQTLVHPFILPIKESFNAKDEYGQDYHYVVSELAMGGTLEELLEKRKNEGKPMSESELMSLFGMLVLAIEQTHTQG